jgi:hypothetical protein
VFQRMFARVVGTLLIVSGLIVSYWWFYRLSPSRHTLDPDWYNSHSQQEYWREIQKGIRRGVWNHDDGFTVGMYGDKSWASRIMADVRPGTQFGGCFAGHREVAMQYLTNQDAGEDAERWLTWWEINKSKSQEEWIADGFTKFGVVAEIPPTIQQRTKLLELLRDQETEEAVQIPEYVKYNAYRWLRDSGFDAVEFALANKQISEAVEKGLVEYSRRQRYLPIVSDVGVLPFAVRETGGDIPRMLAPRFQVAVHTLIWLLFFMGPSLVIFSFWRTLAESKSRTRVLRFSLSMLLIGMAAIGVFFGGWVANAWRAMD